MATTWQDNLIKFDLSYWVIRTGKIGELAQLVDGILQFDIVCQPLEINEAEPDFDETIDVLRKRCKRLFTKLCRKHGLSQKELLEIVGHAVIDNGVNIDTIETDDERDKRLSKQQQRNKNFFDKYSEEL